MLTSRWLRMTGRVFSISSGMTQNMPGLKCLRRHLHQKNANSSKHQLHIHLCCSWSFPRFIFFYIFKISTFTFRFCGSCVRTKEREDKDKPRVFEPLENENHDTKALYAMACFKGEQFRVGDSVYLPPEAFNFRWVLLLFRPVEWWIHMYCLTLFRSFSLSLHERGVYMCSAASATRGPSLHTGRLFIFLFFSGWINFVLY